MRGANSLASSLVHYVRMLSLHAASSALARFRAIGPLGPTETMSGSRSK